MSPLQDIPGEDSSSDRESCSDITLNEDPDVPQRTYRRDSLTAWSEEVEDPVSPSSFPIHLLSGCSAAERVMCQYSGSITAQMVQAQGRIGLKGTLTWRWAADPHQPRAPGSGWWTLERAVIAHGEMSPAPRDMQAELLTFLVKPG
jgi:hypothetical protein